MRDKGQDRERRPARQSADFDNVVLDKSIFSNIFDKDIRRVYIYKKAERLAKAIHLISPAFRNSPALRGRLDQVAVGLIDAAIEQPGAARDRLSRELLALSSVLSIARSGGMLSSMNAELIAREAHQLLQEIATYEEPRMFLGETPSIASLAKDISANGASQERAKESPKLLPQAKAKTRDESIGHISDKTGERRSAIISVLRSKGPSHIKDISTVIRGVSEKTIQRELQSLVESGEILRSGERRWTTYRLKG